MLDEGEGAAGRPQHRTCAVADAAYARERVSTSTRIDVEIVRKQPEQVGPSIPGAGWSSASSQAGHQALVSIYYPQDPRWWAWPVRSLLLLVPE
jgi:hypothetical protein